MSHKQSFRSKVKHLLQQIYKEDPSTINKAADDPRVIFLLNEFVDDFDNHLTVEDLETIVEEEVIKFLS